METGLTTINPSMDIQLEAQNKMADAFAASGMFPDIKSKAQAFVKIQAGHELGLPPFYSMQHFVIINGKVTIDAQAMGFLVKRSGRYDYRVDETTDTRCEITFYERESLGKGEIGKSVFTIEDAKRAGLLNKGPWATYPKAMLFARALSQGSRMHCPDATGGAYVTEELESSPSYSRSESDIEFDKIPSAGDAYRAAKAEELKAEGTKVEYIPAPKAKSKKATPKADEPVKGAEYFDDPTVAPGTPDPVKGEESQEVAEVLMLGHVDAQYFEHAYNALTKAPSVGRKPVWAQSLMVDWLRVHGAKGERVTDLVVSLNVENARAFIGEIDDRLSLLGEVA